MSPLTSPRSRWPGITLSALALLGIIVAISLGQWQTRRAESKRHWQQQLLQASQAMPLDMTANLAAFVPALEWRRVVLQGQWLSNKTIYLDNRVRDGVVGFYVLTPLQLQGRAESVLVNRGWIARDVRHIDVPPAVKHSVGEVRIEGVLRQNISSPLRLLSFSAAAPVGDTLPRIWPQFNLADYQRASHLAVLPWIVFQENSSSTQHAPASKTANITTNVSDSLIRDWGVPALGVETHRAYALQWYAMALAIAVLWGGGVWRKAFTRSRRP